MSIDQIIHQFVQCNIDDDLLSFTDCIYATNRLLALLQRDSIEPNQFEPTTHTRLDMLDILAQDAVDRIDNVQYDQIEADIMNIFTPLPSQVNEVFWHDYLDSPQKATDFFFSLSKKNNYIQTRAIAKNVFFQKDTSYGTLSITINLSKPEKDPKQIAAERSAPSGGYPICLLCAENEGYEGRINHPARSNHRIIRISLGDELWGLQYSPYAYYNEHCIFLNSQHVPMQINRSTFHRLLDIVRQFAHYFVGSNADLPIVGGSILSHDHYQGGLDCFPMTNASVLYNTQLTSFPNVNIGILKWPLSVLRLSSQDIEELEECATYILSSWRNYSDPSANILAFSDEIPHNTITPIARYRNNRFELDLVLRNNRTDEEHPFGIFHPRESLHHIKKENIGLIEVMGLAVLPARLALEQIEIERFLLGENNTMNEIHKEWALSLIEKNPSPDNVSQIVRDGIGDVFLQVLCDAGVFKQTDAGIKQFIHFVDTL